MEYFTSTIHDDPTDPLSTIPYADDNYSDSYTSGIRLHDDLDDSDTNGNSVDIDIEALLNRPRYRGRLRNKPLESAPEFVKRLEPFFEVPAGVPVVFECKICSFPNAIVRWYMDDEEVTDAHARYHINADDAHGLHQLLIECAGKADEGAFKCKAENTEGVASTTGYLSVTGDDRDKSQAAQHRRLHREQAVSSPPPLCTIIEQQSVEEREGKAQDAQGPSPIQGYINNIRKGTNWTLINMMHLYHSFTSSKDESDEDNESSTDSQGDVIDSSEPSTPTAEYDFNPILRHTDVASWTELAQSLSTQTEPESEHNTSNESHTLQDDVRQNIPEQTVVCETASVVEGNHDKLASFEDTISNERCEYLETQLRNNQDILTKDISHEQHCNYKTKLTNTEAVNPETIPEPKASKKRVMKITKERRKKLKKQPSLVELTLQWCIIKFTLICGEQLDKPWLYYFAFTILGACFAVAVELNPIYMVAAVGLLSFMSFYFILKCL